MCYAGSRKAEAVCLFVDKVEVSTDLLPDYHSSNLSGETVKSETVDDTRTDGKGGANLVVAEEKKLVFNTIKCLDVEKSDEYYGYYENCESALIANTLYENKFSGNAKKLQVLIQGGLAIDVKNINQTSFTGSAFTKAIERSVRKM